jgi:hypothetical protein
MRSTRRNAEWLLAAALLFAGLPARAAVLETENNGPGGSPDPIPGTTPGGVVVRGSIAPGDVDFFSFTATAGDLITVSLLEDGLGDFADPQLAVFAGGSTTPLATDDDDGQGFLPSLRLVVPAGGESLRVAVSGFGDAGFDGSHQESFAYQLVVGRPPPGATESDEVGNDTTPDPLGTGAFDALAPGGAATLTGTLLAATPGGSGDVDLYSLPVEPGRLLSVSLFDAGEGDFFDPVLRVLAPSDPDLQDDDDGPGLLAQILEWLGITVPAAQPWTVEVTRFRDEPGNDLDTPYTLVASLSARLCDADGDREVDQTDIESILAARGTPVGPSDARDLDQDLVLTVLDSRACVAHCDRARCARGCGLLGIEALLPLLVWSARRSRTGLRRHP